MDTRGAATNVSYNIDYNVLEVVENEEKYIGLVEFIVDVKAKIKKAILFKVSLKMEGVFIGNAKKLDFKHFNDLLELNGIALYLI
ncbi:hypothetical protein [Caloranaerobacter azorensis]|uniref:Uncharacterized protein n=1 Tax=Caloranaerobacter azorensis DSM 13643 TaxID=1121264 RepID=A0A1M5VZ73_9FIRM|nr:hypothetical protein [Caloranaerobacter azorensis]SHH80572.1 hypothetical protein SAMN02745135_02210 [Caloranaerobacter azorensis DSM 13643]